MTDLGGPAPPRAQLGPTAAQGLDEWRDVGGADAAEGIHRRHDDADCVFTTETSMMARVSPTA